MNESNLKELGIKIGHRKHIMHKLNDFKNINHSNTKEDKSSFKPIKLDPSIQNWNCNELTVWLEEKGLGEFKEKFLEESIAGKKK